MKNAPGRGNDTPPPVPRSADPAGCSENSAPPTPPYASGAGSIPTAPLPRRANPPRAAPKAAAGFAAQARSAFASAHPSGDAPARSPQNSPPSPPRPRPSGIGCWHHSGLAPPKSKPTHAIRALSPDATCSACIMRGGSKSASPEFTRTGRRRVRKMPGARPAQDERELIKKVAMPPQALGPVIASVGDKAQGQGSRPTIARLPYPERPKGHKSAKHTIKTAVYPIAGRSTPVQPLGMSNLESRIAWGIIGTGGIAHTFAHGLAKSRTGKARRRWQPQPGLGRRLRQGIRAHSRPRQLRGAARPTRKCTPSTSARRIPPTPSGASRPRARRSTSFAKSRSPSTTPRPWSWPRPRASTAFS